MLIERVKSDAARAGTAARAGRQLRPAARAAGTERPGLRRMRSWAGITRLFRGGSSSGGCPGARRHRGRLPGCQELRTCPRSDQSEGVRLGRSCLGPVPPGRSLPWAELHCHSNYSFLDGASRPAELVNEAARLGLSALAITDHDGMYGVPVRRGRRALAGYRSESSPRSSGRSSASVFRGRPRASGGVRATGGKRVCWRQCPSGRS